MSDERRTTVMVRDLPTEMAQVETDEATTVPGGTLGGSSWETRRASVQEGDEHPGRGRVERAVDHDQAGCDVCVAHTQRSGRATPPA